MQLFIFSFIIITRINCDISSLHSAYFRILYEYNFEQANLCLSSLNILTVGNMNRCQIACLKHQLCRTATFHQITNQCHLFSERLEDGQIKPLVSTIVISLIKRHPSNGYILTQITSPTDTIIGIWNTSAGQDSTSIDLNSYTKGGSPPNQDVSKAIDNDILTKHVSYGDGCNTCNSITAGHNTGFYIIPTRSSIITHLCWATSKELNETARDPIHITIEGSNQILSSHLIYGSSWSLIYNGTSGLDADLPRSTYKLIDLYSLNFIQSYIFKSYRLLIVQKRGSEDSVQYSEIQLFGRIINE